MEQQEKSSFISYFKRGAKSAKGNLGEITLLVILMHLVLAICRVLPIGGSDWAKTLFTTIVGVIFYYGIRVHTLNIVRGKESDAIDSIVSIKGDIKRTIGAHIYAILFKLVVLILLIYTVGSAVALGLEVILTAIGFPPSYTNPGIGMSIFILTGTSILMAFTESLLPFIEFIRIEEKDISAYKIFNYAGVYAKPARRLVFPVELANIIAILIMETIFLDMLPSYQIFTTSMDVIRILIGVWVSFTLAHIYIDFKDKINTKEELEGEEKEGVKVTTES